MYPGREAECAALANLLDAPLVQQGAPVSGRYVLDFDDKQRLQLVDNDVDNSAVLCIDLAKKKPGQGVDPLMRAIGHQTTTVIDCTAGWCTDAAHIAAHGISVTAIERHPVVYALVADALRRCTNAAIRAQLNLVRADSLEWLAQGCHSAEVIYLDPMYPPKAGTALPKKPLQFLHHLAQRSSEQESALLTIARRCASRRVVVKRPHHAAPVLPGKSGEISAKLVRFDLYPPTR